MARMDSRARMRSEPVAPAAPAGGPARAAPARAEAVRWGRYTREEVARHCTRESCWLTAHGKVYDVTEFIDLHDAGPESILNRARQGGEATKDFDFHLSFGRSVWKQYEIGELDEARSGCGLM